jgi:CheY-like chemotaxis protein
MTQQATSRVRNTQQHKILVVDDNPDAAELVSALLERQGHAVRSAYTPAEGIRIALEFQPDVAFLDIGLPTMDGFELAAALRAMPELRACRFIAITGYDDAEDRRQSKRLGFEAHLVKPIALETLVSALAGNGARNAARSAV